MSKELLPGEIRELLRKNFGIDVGLEFAIEISFFLEAVIEVLLKYGVKNER